MPCDSIDVRPGRNLWALARTDRDGADLDTVIRTAGAFLAREVLGPASPLGTRSIFETLQSTRSTDREGRFVIGSARPTLVTAIQAATPDQVPLLVPVNPGGALLGRWQDCDTIRTVRAQLPWIVFVEFDWRGPRTSIDWPRVRVSDFGTHETPDHDLDWLLLVASHEGAAQESDTDLLDEVTADTKQKLIAAANSATAPALALAGIAVASFVVYQIAKRKFPKAFA